MKIPANLGWVNGKRRFSLEDVKEAQQSPVNTPVSLIWEAQHLELKDWPCSVFAAAALRISFESCYKSWSVFVCSLVLKFGTNWSQKCTLHIWNFSRQSKRSGECGVSFCWVFCKCCLLPCLLSACILFITFHARCQAPLLFILSKPPLVVI